MYGLPNCLNAEVCLKKIENYLLNSSHPEGMSKANFFIRFGYSVSNSGDFRRELVNLACEGKVVKIDFRPPFGTRITMDARLNTPDHRNPKIRIGWFLDFDDIRQIPRLITVIPLKDYDT